MECQQTAMLTAGGYHRNCSPALYGQGNITGSKTDNTLSSHPLHRGHEKKIVYKPPLPRVGYSLGFPEPLPEVGRTGSFQSPAYDAEEIKLSVSNYFPITHIFSKIHLWIKCSLGQAKNYITLVVIVIYTVPAQQKWNYLILTEMQFFWRLNIPY